MMFRGFDIAMYHICSTPLLDFVGYGRLVATSRFAADKVSHCTAVAQLRGFWAFDLALFHIIYDQHLGSDDYRNLMNIAVWTRGPFRRRPFPSPRSRRQRALYGQAIWRRMDLSEAEAEWRMFVAGNPKGKGKQ